MTIDIVPLKPDLFAIRFHRRRWLKQWPYKAGRERGHGWRSIIWTENYDEAEKFATHHAAESSAETYIPYFRQNSQLTSAAAKA